VRDLLGLVLVARTARHLALRGMPSADGSCTGNLDMTVLRSVHFCHYELRKCRTGATLHFHKNSSAEVQNG
jgi:hypothetical protein